MAPRLMAMEDKRHTFQPFWIAKKLPRKGIVAGKYQIQEVGDMFAWDKVIELEKPHLLPGRIIV